MSDQRSTQLERAIASQPEELGRLLRTPLPHDTVERLRQAHRIWLVGTGTSLHAAELGAAMLHDAGRAAYAMSSMRFVNWAPPMGAVDAVVVISHNAGAETAYAAAAYTMGMDAGLRVIPIVRRGGGLVGAIETVDKERSHTYSVSYTAALLILAWLADALGAEATRRTARPRARRVQVAIDARRRVDPNQAPSPFGRDRCCDRPRGAMPQWRRPASSPRATTSSTSSTGPRCRSTGGIT
jgi:glucosamine--fructose-6-phosphate aminotransferase (isomerizing)